MVLIHIICNTDQQATEIVDLLVEEKLILNAVILERVVVRKKGGNGQLQSEKQTLIMGKTKSLLFNNIDERLREKYKDEMPDLYSVPIVNMDWEQTGKLMEETLKV